MAKNPIELDGLWKYNWDSQVLDDKSAMAAGHVRKDGTPAPHGTYTPVKYFRVRTSPKGKVLHAVLDIFSDGGDFAHFVWNGSDAWEAKADEVKYQVAADDARLKKSGELPLRPSLVLRRYEAANRPTGAPDGARYIESVSDAIAHTGEIAAQRITPNEIDRTKFSWNSAEHEQGLTFTSCYQQEHMSGDGAKSFGDTFLGATKMAQVAFPFYGFNPSNMSLYAANPQELTPTGPGTPRAGVIRTNPHQSFNGTLVFAFPREDSMDYVRVEDLHDQPFLPLGLAGIPLDSREERAHTEMVSSTQERMRSWSVTLGLSAGLDKVMDIGGKGSVSSKVEEQTRTQCRYSVSRKIAKRWAILADPASHRLHDDFTKAVISNTVALLSGSQSQSQWEDFVTSYGTHYAHAITQGSIDYAETRFSLKAETQAHSMELNLQQESSAVIEGVGVKTSAGYGAKWKDSHGIEISKEDITSYSVGSDDPMGIFFDLRPLDELFSPVFFPYNPADDDGKLAPFIWHTARKSFSDYLRKRAADSAVAIDFSRNYTPRKFKVTVFPMSVKHASEPHPLWYGSIELAGDKDEGNALEVNSLTIPRESLGVAEPAKGALFCTLTAPAGIKKPLRFLISVDIVLTVRQPGYPAPVDVDYARINVVDRQVELTLSQSVPGGKDAATAKVKLDGHACWIELAVDAVDVGLLD